MNIFYVRLLVQCRSKSSPPTDNSIFGNGSVDKPVPFRDWTLPSKWLL